MGILFTINNESEQGNDNLCKALAIFLQTTGEKSFLYLTTRFNQILIECITKFAVSKLDILREAVHALANIFPANHQLVTFLNAENLIRELSNQDTKFQGTFLWNTCFVSVLDRPFSWIDYPPLSKVVILGADQQVWAHLKNLQHAYPKRYSWLSAIFLGSFHKLGNAHDKLMKRYGKFHLEKHAVSFLDDPSGVKVKYLLSNKDFDTSNDFFLSRHYFRSD